MNALSSLVWIALGGAAGSVCRALAGMAFATRFPWGTLLINASGSLLIGWLIARIGPGEPGASPRMVSLLVVGFCGGFTTFSTFSWQTFEQLQKGLWGAAIANVVLSVTLCLLAVWAGFSLGKT
jgi:CrcB protein